MTSHPNPNTGRRVSSRCSAPSSAWTPVTDPATAEAFEMLATPRAGPGETGGPLSEGDPRRVPPCGSRAGHWTRAHEVTLPVWLRLPEVLQASCRVLFQTRDKQLWGEGVGTPHDPAPTRPGCRFSKCQSKLPRCQRE